MSLIEGSPDGPERSQSLTTPWTVKRVTYFDCMHDNSIINSFISQIIYRIDIRLVSNSTWLNMLCPILKEQSSTIVCSLKSMLYLGPLTSRDVLTLQFVSVCLKKQRPISTSSCSVIRLLMHVFK